MILRYLLPALISVGLTGLMILAQMLRFRKVTAHPWKDVFSHKPTMIIYIVLRMIALFALSRAVVRRDFESAFGCVLALLLFSMPFLVEKWCRIEFSPVMESIVLLFIFAAEILGEVDNYYVLIPGWDTALHTTNGFLCAAIGFALADMLNRSDNKISLSPFFLAVVAFCFSMTIAVLWEFVEFTADTHFALDMQKDTLVQSFHSVTLNTSGTNAATAVTNITRTVIETADGTGVVIEGGYLDIGLRDTVKDMFVNCIGALVFCSVGYVGLKFGRDSKLAKAFVPLVKKPRDLIAEAPKTEPPAGKSRRPFRRKRNAAE